MRWQWAQWFEKRWWKNYLKNKPVAEYLDWKANYWHSFLIQIEIDLPQGKKVLDAGCGPAGIFTVLHGNEITAMDPLLDSYENELRHFSKSNYPNVNFQKRGLETIDWKAEFDYVFCLNVINHVEDIQKSVSLLADALKPGSTMVLSIDAHNFKFPKYLFRALPLDILHPHQYDLNEYISMAENAGLSCKKSVLIKSAFLFDYYALVLEKP